MLAFEMSGQVFRFDESPEALTADDIFVVEDEVGMSVEEVLELVASGFENGTLIGRALRAICAIAWLVHRREGGQLGWRAFCKTVAPATLRVVAEEQGSTEQGPTGDGGARRPSATRQRPKSRKAS